MNEAKRTCHFSVRQMHRVASVKSDVRFTGDQGIIMKTLINRCIVNDKSAILQNGMPTERDITWRFPDTETLACNQPLSFAIQQAYQNHRYLKDAPGKPGQTIKTLIVSGIKQVCEIKRL